MVVVSMELVLMIGVVIVGFAGVGWWVSRKMTELTRKDEGEETLREWLKTMQTSVEATNKAVNESLRMSSGEMNKALRDSSKALNERLDNAARYMSQVAKEVGAMSEIGRGMKELQEFLRSPKLRGNLGEEVLKDLIGQMFPKQSFHLQYSFKSGEKVDAAIQTEAGILPIDSKFPMENFRKMAATEEEKEREGARRMFINDVRKHIRDISQKYILPDEGTMDFALMYVPSEPVYYEIANTPEVIEYARSARVYPVSPTTLYAHLQVILLSFEGKKIEARSKRVFQLLRSLQKDYGKTEEQLGVLSRHLGNAWGKMGEVNQAFSLLGQKISQGRALGEGEEASQLRIEDKQH
jgi:DNA recombination protein RmuC